MELRAFAEQVLFATTLEEKLHAPGVITDSRPGPALAAPPHPGRPVGLRFKATGSGRADLPGLHQLEQEAERGRLLHFFANHELLATELMALVLLRFPEAPPAFRRGVLRTLQDEQLHTRLYLDRMKACGIHFGDLPVSGYFWRAVSTMQSPIDYVAGLSLTFEQANLDFARHFARMFAKVGDTETARLLNRIYRDEISHVAYGLKWFRRWKDHRLTDWEAFCRQLKFPLSPQRAKGMSFNAEGRRAAGLGADFITALDVYSQSKGRTSGVFLFNPFAEGYIAQGSAFTPVRHQVALARDLANLPQFLCRQDDIVLVPERPRTPFIASLRQTGFALPEFVEIGRDPTGAAGLAELAERKLGRLRPWAWGPDSVELLHPLFARATAEPRTPHGSFNEPIARLYSKAWSADFLRRFLQSINANQRRLVCTEDEVGAAVDSLDAALAVISAIRQRGHHKVVVKEAVGLAGHNAIRLWEPEILETQRRWMKKAVRNSGQLVVEPWLERDADFSVQFEMTTQGLQCCGYAGLINDRKGQYRGNWAAPGYRRQPPIEAITLIRHEGGAAIAVRRIYDAIRRQLEAELRQAGYVGPLGIDAFVYRLPSGEHRLKPIVEINPRYTMGRLTLELMKQTTPGSRGLFRLLNRRELASASHASFEDYAARLSLRIPLRLEGEPVPRIHEGALCLNDPATAAACLATFAVSREAGETIVPRAD